MRVRVYPADGAGCGWYRMRYPAYALQAAGYDIHIHDDGILMPDARVKEHGKDPWEIVGGTLPDADVVVLQRPSHPALEACIRFLVAEGITVIIDIDDRFDALRRSNMAWGYYSDPYAITVLRRSLDAATLVTCSTPDLQDIHDGILLENCIPGGYLAVADDHKELVGWSGTLAVHREDLKVTNGGVARALHGSGWGFHVIGEAWGVKGELGLHDEPTDTGWLDLDSYPTEVARLGVGIAPLADHAFNRAKSWLKALEYSALGVPFVASDMPEYQRLGAGMLAGNARQWKGMVSALIHEPALREAERVRNREIAKRHTFEGNAHRWAHIWFGQS